jgi:hypothetical protein
MAARSPVWFNRDSVAVWISPLVMKLGYISAELGHENRNVYRSCFDCDFGLFFRVSRDYLYEP